MKKREFLNSCSRLAAYINEEGDNERRKQKRTKKAVTEREWTNSLTQNKQDEWGSTLCQIINEGLVEDHRKRIKLEKMINLLYQV